jgi:hypothetical protein
MMHLGASPSDPEAPISTVSAKKIAPREKKTPILN